MGKIIEISNFTFGENVIDKQALHLIKGANPSGFSAAISDSRACIMVDRASVESPNTWANEIPQITDYSYIPIPPGSKFIYASIKASGYFFGVIAVAEDGSYLADSGWQTTPQILDISSLSDAKFVRFALRTYTGAFSDGLTLSDLNAHLSFA